MINETNFDKMYLCGPTLYSDIHIGNLRSLIIFDALKRANPLSVYARNITDVDDKIINKCGSESPHQWVIRETYPAFKKVLSDLSILDPDVEPFASDYVQTMIQNIELLMENHPSKIQILADGVVFDPSDSSSYGEISNRNSLNAKNPENNAWYLWKNNFNPLEFSWESPWGNGRPGWHIECSTMIRSIFGEDGIDLHGGGTDLIFPHHENENAEYKAMCGCNKTFSKKWLHIGMVKLDGAKMAKSTGNTMLVKDLLLDWSPSVIRCSMLFSSPSKPINITVNRFKEIEKLLHKSRITDLTNPLTPLQITQINNFNFRDAIHI